MHLLAFSVIFENDELPFWKKNSDKNKKIFNSEILIISTNRQSNQVIKGKRTHIYKIFT